MAALRGLDFLLSLANMPLYLFLALCLRNSDGEMQLGRLSRDFHVSNARGLVLSNVVCRAKSTGRSYSCEHDVLA